MLTRKHFEGIANAVNDAHLPYDFTVIVARKLADELLRHNAAFDREKFIHACVYGVSGKTPGIRVNSREVT